MRNFAIDGEIARMENILVSFTDLNAETLRNVAANLEEGETIDELTESLLRRYTETRDVEASVNGEIVGRAVARAFRKSG